MECRNEGKIACDDCYFSSVAADADVRMSRDRDLTPSDAKALAEADNLRVQLEQQSVVTMSHAQRERRAVLIGKAVARGEDYRDLL